MASLRHHLTPNCGTCRRFGPTGVRVSTDSVIQVLGVAES
jgi:hypothetical protein